jgi:O-acetylhomoserine (thiol)-lyase
VGAAARDNTKAFFCESIGNPKGNVVDLAAVADARTRSACRSSSTTRWRRRTWCARSTSAPTSSSTRPPSSSAARHLDRRLIVSNGVFDFAAGDRFPQYTTPDPSYHGLVYSEALGPMAYILKARVQLLRDLGPALSPFNAFLLLQGIETLSLRMERHVANAQAVAEWLEGRDEVEWVAYAGLPSSEFHETARKIAPRGPGSLVSFGIRGGLEAGKAFVDALELHSHVANIGDVRSLVIHRPAPPTPS